MKSLLAGATGFVGSNLARQAEFTFCANSKNLNAATGQEFDLVVFSAVPAVKWWANANKEKDFATIVGLRDFLSTISAKQFVLISTVDVYPFPVGVDERTQIDSSQCLPYGRHRFWFECEVRRLFPQCTIVRLPALFGPGLKKNVLFDLVNLNMVEKINLASAFQWYPIARLWKDITHAMNLALPLLNISVEPIPTERIHTRFFRSVPVGADPAAMTFYDVRTHFSEEFAGSSNGYLLTAEEVMSELSAWLTE